MKVALLKDASFVIILYRGVVVHQCVGVPKRGSNDATVRPEPIEVVNGSYNQELFNA